MNTIQFVDRKTQEIITETPPGESFLKFLYHNPLGVLPLHLLVKRKFLSALYGRLMDRPNSAKRIKAFVDSLNIDMSEAQKSIGEFTSFNDFFYRKLKKEARPIEAGIVSPADGKILVFEKISDLKHFFVKGNKFTLAKYLQDEQLTEKYKDFSLILVRLAPNDYHRFHFPYAGHITDSKKINGYYYSVSPYAVKENFTIFCENKREYAILSTADKGEILLSEIGATMVGTIAQTYTANSQIAKGEEKGYFAFGGSSVIMLVDSKKVKIDSDLLENTRKGQETFVRMGEKIAT